LQRFQISSDFGYDPRLRSSVDREMMSLRSEFSMKVGVMTLRAVRTPDEEIELLRRRVERLQSNQDSFREMPSEPFHEKDADSPVVWFAKTWGEDKRYEYVTLHVKGKGWIVSHQGKKLYLSWNDLLVFALLKEPDDEIPCFWLATSWHIMSTESDA
jgi:hypothetical protein